MYPVLFILNGSTDQGNFTINVTSILNSLINCAITRFILLTDDSIFPSKFLVTAMLN